MQKLVINTGTAQHVRQASNTCCSKRKQEKLMVSTCIASFFAIIELDVRYHLVK